MPFQSLPSVRFSGLSSPAVLVGLLALAMASQARAQSVVPPAPSEPVMSAFERKQLPPPPQSQPPSPPLNPFQFGDLIFHPRVSYSYVRSDGLPTQGALRVSSKIQTFSPGLSAELGEHWALDYGPSWVRYSSSALTDNVEQSASLSGSFAGDDWSFHLAESFSKTNRTLVETASQVEEKNWSTGLSGTYRFTPKLSLLGSAGLSDRKTSVPPNVRTWSASTMVQWAVSPQLSFRLGPGYTYEDIAAAANTSSKKYTAGLSWLPSQTLSLDAEAGTERTHSNSTTGRDLSNPLVHVSLSYHPLEATSLSLSHARSTSTSYFSDQLTENTSWSVSLNQRLIGHFYLSTGYSWQNQDYTATRTATTTTRADKVKLFNARLTTTLFTRLTLAATWSQSKNASSESFYTFNSTQYGLELSYRY